MKVWFHELDILKATAILLIVFCHLDNYVSNNELIRLIDNYAAIAGLNIFFFVSGFLLSQNDSIISSNKDILKFYKKKFIRIFPLYWAALASLVIVFGLLKINPGYVSSYNFNMNNLLLHFFGLQGIFPYGNIQSMWFVGVIILFYILFPIIVYLSKNAFKIFMVSSIILIIFLILHLFCGLIDINALIYFPVFISGIFINKILYSSEKLFNKDLLKKIVFLNLVLIVVVFLIFVLRKIFNLNLQVFTEILMICAMISLCIIYLIFTRLFIKIRGKIMLLISLIAFATYAIYLFQHQFLAVFSLIIVTIILNIIFQDIIILTFGFAGAILCGIIIQKLEQYVFMTFKRAHNDNI